MITDEKILVGLEERVYYMVMRLALHYGSVIWPIKETSLQFNGCQDENDEVDMRS